MTMMSHECTLVRNLSEKIEKLLCKCGIHNAIFSYDMRTTHWKHAGYVCFYCGKPLAYEKSRSFFFCKTGYMFLSGVSSKEPHWEKSK